MKMTKENNFRLTIQKLIYGSDQMAFQNKRLGKLA